MVLGGLGQESCVLKASVFSAGNDWHILISFEEKRRGGRIRKKHKRGDETVRTKLLSGIILVPDFRQRMKGFGEEGSSEKKT